MRLVIDLTSAALREYEPKRHPHVDVYTLAGVSVSEGDHSTREGLTAFLPPEAPFEVLLVDTTMTTSVAASSEVDWEPWHDVLQSAQSHLAGLIDRTAYLFPGKGLPTVIIPCKPSFRLRVKEGRAAIRSLDDRLELIAPTYAPAMANTLGVLTLDAWVSGVSCRLAQGLVCRVSTVPISPR